MVRRLAWIFAVTGALVFAALTAMLFSTQTQVRIPAIAALVTFAAVVLSYLGGVEGGLALQDQTGTEHTRAIAFALSSLPALAAWGVLWLPSPHWQLGRRPRALRGGMVRRPVARAPGPGAFLVRGHAHRRDRRGLGHAGGRALQALSGARIQVAGVRVMAVGKNGRSLGFPPEANALNALCEKCSQGAQGEAGHDALAYHLDGPVSRASHLPLRRLRRALDPPPWRRGPLRLDPLRGALPAGIRQPMAIAPRP